MLKRRGKVIIAGNIVAGVMLGSSQSVIAKPGVLFLQYYYVIRKCCPEHFSNNNFKKYKELEGYLDAGDSEDFAKITCTIIGESDNYTNDKHDSDEKVGASEKKEYEELSKVKKYFDKYGEEGEKAFKQFVKEASYEGYIALKKGIHGNLQNYVDYVCTENISDNGDNYTRIINSLELEEAEGSLELFKKYESKLKKPRINTTFIFPQ